MPRLRNGGVGAHGRMMASRRRLDISDNFNFLVLFSLQSKMIL